MDSDWLSMNLVEFQLERTSEWFLRGQDQIHNLLENQELPQQDARGSVSSLIQRLFDKSIAMNASDIHLEMQKEVLRVRFRIDGVLQEISRLPKELSTRIPFQAQGTGRYGDLPEKVAPGWSLFLFLGKTAPH